MLSFRLAVRALAWRAAASVTVFIVALIGITAAAVGPIYLHAVDDAVLADRLTHAPQSLRDVHIVQDTTIGINDVDWHAAVTALSGQARPTACSPPGCRSSTRSSSATGGWART